MRFEEGKFQCTYIIPAGLKAFNLLYSLELQLFHERCSFSPPRLPPCGVPRCMGRSDGKRNAPCGFQIPCSPCPGLRRSAGRSPGSGCCKQAAASSSRCCGCIMQGILGKAGGLLNFLKPVVTVFALGHRGRELSCFSAFHGAHAFLCCSKNSIEELACIGEAGLQRTFLILSGFQAQLDDKGRCARFHSG